MTHGNWGRYLLLLIFLVIGQNKARTDILISAKVGGLHTYSEESEEFRSMQISVENLEWIRQCSEEQGISFSECLAAAMVMEKFDLSGEGNLQKRRVLEMRQLLRERKKESYERLSLAYEKIFSDLVCFPVPKNSDSGRKEQSFFENSYGEARTFGGSRSHEGIDVFGLRDTEGYYPVVSVTDGVVEKIGWLPLGGYRIGVRSPRGGYFYYAHLSAYGKNYREGDRVSAGELLGFMGSTGYGPEGTEGKFPVHLHFGIYIATDHQEEMSINPYPVLLLLKKEIQEYQY